MSVKFLVLTVTVLTSASAFAQKSPFSHKSELAIVSTGGNSRVETYNAKVDNKYVAGKRTYGLSGHYTLSLSEQEGAEDNADLVESTKNWDWRVSYEQKLNKNISLFTAVQFEGDIFSGIEQRENYDIGAKHIFVNTDKESFYIEGGYRYTEERRTEADLNGRKDFHFNKAVVTTELQRKRDTFTYGIWLQYVPNFSDGQDYQINVEPSFTVFLSDIFSMKLAYRGNYDNEPNVEGNERLDWRYTTALVAEF